MKTIHLLAALGALACTAGSARADAPLRSGDSFDLRLGGVPSDDAGAISSNYTVDGEGCLNLSYLGKVHVAGMTPSQIQATVERAYVDRGIFTHPTVTLNIAAAARFINVGGDGMKGSSRVPYTPDLTFLSVIVAAGDFNDFGDAKHIRLIRGGTTTIINYREIQKHPEKDIKVFPGDVIQVPQSIF